MWRSSKWALHEWTKSLYISEWERFWGHASMVRKMLELIVTTYTNKMLVSFLVAQSYELQSYLLLLLFLLFKTNMNFNVKHVLDLEQL